MAQVSDTGAWYNPTTAAAASVTPSSGPTAPPPPPAATPPGTSNTVVPIDTTIQHGLAAKAWENANNRLNAQFDDTKQKYGYNADGTVDPNNKYGLYQTMLRDQARDFDHARVAQRGRNLTGGLAQHQFSDMRFDQGRQQNDLATGWINFLRDRQLSQNENDYTKSQSDWQIDNDAKNQAIQNSYFTPANAAGVDAEANNIVNPPAVPQVKPPGSPTTLKQAVAKKTVRVRPR